jgi:hypothetical protein
MRGVVHCTLVLIGGLSGVVYLAPAQSLSPILPLLGSGPSVQLALLTWGCFYVYFGADLSSNLVYLFCALSYTKVFIDTLVH